LVKSFRNIPGIELVNVERLNLLTLAPGGHLGRFVIWTESAFKQLNNIFGTLKKYSQVKGGFRIPRPVISNADISRIITSDEVQSVLRMKKIKPAFQPIKANPLKNLGSMIKLNPYALSKRRAAIKINYRNRQRKLKQADEGKKPKGKEPVKKTSAPKKTIGKDKKKGAKEVKKTLRTTKRASRSWIKLLTAPAIAPKRAPEEAPPKYQ